jgi:hypothetical protein
MGREVYVFRNVIIVDLNISLVLKLVYCSYISIVIVICCYERSM